MSHALWRHRKNMFIRLLHSQPGSTSDLESGEISWIIAAWRRRRSGTVLVRIVKNTQPHCDGGFVDYSKHFLQSHKSISFPLTRNYCVVESTLHWALLPHSSSRVVAVDIRGKYSASSSSVVSESLQLAAAAFAVMVSSSSSSFQRSTEEVTGSIDWSTGTNLFTGGSEWIGLSFRHQENNEDTA